MTKKPNYHIMNKSKGEWTIRRSGAAKDTSTVSSVTEALLWCKERARTVYLHDKFGRIRETVYNG